MPLFTGDKLGPYEIIAPIGAGGMGQVFSASDTRLHRTVAIKILPHDKVADPDRKRRFLQEARAASALNHPNIVTVYDIASDNGVDYLVMEYVPGQSLDKLIKPRAIPPAEVIAYATQIASALAAAHAAGIVHRDIKPANIIAAAGGEIKVLDFGLAKLEERGPGADETRTMLTDVGTVMGTVAYMSPEQARAEAVDARTDLFSFGAVLYEMATGRRAYPRVLDWVTPPMDPLPPELRRIVLKLLELDRDLRYASAADVVADLKRLQGTIDVKKTSRIRWIAAAAAVGALALAAGLFFYLRPSRPAGRDQWVQLTNFPDSVSQPAFSPDGKMLTFVRGADTFSAPGQIYLKQIPGGDPVQLTHDELDKMSPAFSPDGSRIAYTVNPGWSTWVVPVVSGQPRLWLSNASGLTWLDNQRLLFSEIKKNSYMGIVTAGENRAGERDVYFPASVRGMAHRSYPSPDGKSSLVVEMERGGWLPCRLVSLEPASNGTAASSSRPIGPMGGRCTFAGWSRDGKWMYFSSSSNGAFHTWRQHYPDGEPEQVTGGPNEEEGIAMAPDGRSFVTAVAQRQSVVWIHDANGDRPISLEGYSIDPKFTPDGKKLCYRILKGGLSTYDPSELRIVDLAAGNNEPLLPGLEIYGPPGRVYEISRDGRQVVAAAKDAQGKPRIWLAALDRQSPARQIPNVQGEFPGFAKDGEIVFRMVEGQTAYAYVVKQDGSELRRLSNQKVVLPAGISPDGEWIAMRVSLERGEAVVAFPAQGNAPVRTIFAGGTSYHLAWSPDGKLIFVSAPTSATASHIVGKTYVVPLAAGEIFPTGPDGGFNSAAELAKRADVRIIDAFDATPGPTAEVYAYSRAGVQRNLYMIPIP